MATFNCMVTPSISYLPLFSSLVRLRAKEGWIQMQ